MADTGCDCSEIIVSQCYSGSSMLLCFIFVNILNIPVAFVDIYSIKRAYMLRLLVFYACSQQCGWSYKVYVLFIS